MENNDFFEYKKKHDKKKLNFFLEFLANDILKEKQFDYFKDPLFKKGLFHYEQMILNNLLPFSSSAKEKSYYEKILFLIKNLIHLNEKNLYEKLECKLQEDLEILKGLD